MIKLICENPVIKAEIKGTGKDVLEDALNAVHCLYQSLYKNDKRLAAIFKMMLDAEEDTIFNNAEEEVIRFLDKRNTVPEEYEEAARMVDEALKDFREE
jgi:NCAIR mutase (PurE)-related protein